MYQHQTNGQKENIRIEMVGPIKSIIFSDSII
jgi:hypothetical protein